MVRPDLWWVRACNDFYPSFSIAILSSLPFCAWDDQVSGHTQEIPYRRSGVMSSFSNIL